MADLIDRKAFMEKLNKRAYEWRLTPTGDAYRNAVQMLKKEPAVDAVEVRCKDCKHYHLFDDGVKDCRHSGGLNEAYPDDFCSYGERRADDGA